MAPPRNTEILQRYRDEMARSKRWRENEGYDALWKRMKELYKGKHLATSSETDRLIVNMAFATKNVIAPSVAVNNPRFTVQARVPEYQAQAIVAEEVLNYQWRANRYQDQFRLAVDDWLDFGHGWMKVGYKFVQEPKAVRDEGDSPDSEALGISDREPVPGNVESERNITDDRPYAERVSPFNMFVDPDGRTVDDIRWVAQRIRRPVADVRVDERYTGKTTNGGLVRKTAQPTMTTRWGEDTAPDSAERSPLGSKDNAGFCEVIEYYDLRRKTYAVFTDGATEGFLISPEPMPYSFGQPFLMLRNYEVPDEFYPMGELESIETLQYELNETRSQQVNHRKHYARKYLYMEDAFEQHGVDTLESDEDNTMVPVNSGQDIQRVIIPMPAVGIPPDFYNMSEVITNDIDRVTGVSEYMRGDMPDIRRTATEAAMVQDAQQSRAADKMARVEGFLSRLGERVIQLMQQYMTGEQVIRVVGTQAAPVWVRFDKDYIAGQFDYEVEAGSTQPQNETFRRQSAMQLVDAMAPLVGAGVVDPAAIARHVLQFGFGIKSPEQFLAAPQAMPNAGPAPGGPPGQPTPPPGGPPPGGPPPPQQPPPEAGMPGLPPGGMPPQPPGTAMPPGPGDIPPEMLAKLQQMPPEMLQAMVQDGTLPPEILEMLAQLQGGGMPPGMPPEGTPPPVL